MRIIDSFMFCHEFDMLELRLRLLYDYVDYFLLLESDITHSGKPKPLYYEENKARYAPWKDKIIHRIMHGAPKTAVGDFGIEDAQRHYLYTSALNVAGSTYYNAKDLILISDLDEVPSREVLTELRATTPDKPFTLEQDMYYYNITCPRRKKWYGTIGLMSSYPVTSFRILRDTRKNLDRIPNSGWHFTYFMDHDGINTKLESFAHHKQYGIRPFTERKWQDDAIRVNTNFLGKSDGYDDPMPIPQYVVDEMKRFPIMLGKQAA